MFEQALDVLESRDARNTFTGEKFPEQDHETAVGDRKIGGEESAAIILIAAEVDHRWRGRGDQQTTSAGNLVDRLARSAAEEFNPQYSMTRRHAAIYGRSDELGKQEPRKRNGLAEAPIAPRQLSPSLGFILHPSAFILSFVYSRPLHSTLTQTPPVSLAVPRSRIPALLLFTALALLWFILCRDLSLEWSSNEQYSYGWFVPFFAAFLFWLRWEDWGKVEGRKEKVEIARAKRGRRFLLSSFYFLLLLLLLLPVRLFEIANPDWRPLSWIHALTVVGLTLLLIYYVGGKSALRHFAFPVCFILVAVPWVTPIEGPLVQWLMHIVAAVATETLTLFGIPAQLEGSLIRVNNGVVGVSEACSGVRSLQTSLMIGLLFGELKRLTIARRVALVAAALAIALLANFGRALFLVWIAAVKNLAAVERWHDIAGYAIVAAVFLGTVAIASALAKGRSKKEELRSSGPKFHPSSLIPHPSHLPPFYFLLFTFSFLLLIELAVAGWYRWHERLLVPGKQWTAHFPESASGFREVPIDEHTREMLRYDYGRQATWQISPVVRPNAAEPSAGERVGRAYLFFFRWEPGTATVLRARAHRPDICLPAVGWRPLGEPDIRFYQVKENFAMPFQHFSFVHDEPGSPRLYAETFFCLREDRVQPEARESAETLPFSHWSIPERWQVVRSGLRNPGQQVMEFVLLSKHTPNAAEAEKEFAQLVPRLVKAEN
jgi:exosortase